jgi:hypothetical protein
MVLERLCSAAGTTVEIPEGELMIFYLVRYYVMLCDASSSMEQSYGWSNDYIKSGEAAAARL